MPLSLEAADAVALVVLRRLRGRGLHGLRLALERREVRLELLDRGLARRGVLGERRELGLCLRDLAHEVLAQRLERGPLLELLLELLLDLHEVLLAREHLELPALRFGLSGLDRGLGVD